MKTYEAMFLLDAGNSDFEASSAPVREVLARAQAEVLSIRPWDERRLAYKIKGRKRGLYVLTYFKADPAQIDEMQHEIQLIDQVLRAIILSADHLSAEQMQTETPATLANARRAEAEAKRETPSDEAKSSSPDASAPPQEPSGQDASSQDNTTKTNEPGEPPQPQPTKDITDKDSQTQH